METTISTYLPYVIGGIFLLSIVITRVIPFVKKGVQIISHKKYSKNPKGSNLTEEQYVALAVGAINGEQIMSYTDTLTTGIQQEELKSKLSEWWGINDRNSALEILEWLFKAGHREYYHEVYQVFVHNDKPEWPGVIAQRYREHKTVLGYLANLADTYPDLTDESKDGYTIQDFQRGILAWDMGRLVTVARGSFDCRYISEKEAWEYIMGAYYLTKQLFSSWEQLRKSYIIGRAMWGGKVLALDGIKEVANGLLTDSQSPWRTINY